MLRSFSIPGTASVESLVVTLDPMWSTYVSLYSERLLFRLGMLLVAVLLILPTILVWRRFGFFAGATWAFLASLPVAFLLW
jgi:hypothetical protein